MQTSQLSVREMQRVDIPSIIRYWLTADEAFLKAMGVDTEKMPAQEQWEQMLNEQINTPIEQKQSYCIIWLSDGMPIGHSNINKIVFGKEAYMHLHLWYNSIRQQGLGSAFVKLTLPYFFNNYELETLYCEPYALNPAPNKTLEKTGFTFLKLHTTTPGWLNFEQEVNLWELKREDLAAVLL